jgi:hypothetical protein
VLWINYRVRDEFNVRNIHSTEFKNPWLLPWIGADRKANSRSASQGIPPKCQHSGICHLAESGSRSVKASVLTGPDPRLICLLLLRDGIVQSVPCTATICPCTVLPIWVLIIHNSSTRFIWQVPETPSGKAGRKLPKKSVNFSVEYLFHTTQGSLTFRKILRHGAYDLLPLRQTSYYGFLPPLKISHPQPNLNPQTLGPMASMLTIRPPRITHFIYTSMPFLQHRGRCQQSWLVVWRHPIQISPETPSIPTESQRSFLHYFQSNTEIAFLNRKWPLSTQSFEVHQTWSSPLTIRY